MKKKHVTIIILIFVNFYSFQKIHEHMFYRVVLQQFLFEKLGFTNDDWIVGRLKRGKEINDFAAYARKALQNLKLNHLCDEVSIKYVIFN